MKHLKVEYNGVVLFDGEVDEVQWVDGPGAMAISGKFPVERAASGGGIATGLLDMLSAASKKATEAKIEEKRHAAQETNLEPTIL